ncbi:MAG: hypothetical protein ACOYMB_03750 [Patescibacteria group bacterium]
MKLFFGGEKTRDNGPAYKPEYEDGENKNPGEHDPHANPREGAYNNPAANVIDPENNYNQPGFEDREVYNDVVDDSQVGGEIGELMEKYGLEEWELTDLMKKCEAFLNGKEKSSPLKNESEVEELAVFYRDYLAAKNENGFPFSAEELEKVSGEKREELANLYFEKSNLVFKLAETSNFNSEKISNDNFVNTNPDIKYSTKDETLAPNLRPQMIFDLRNINKSIAAIENLMVNRNPKIEKTAEKDLWKEVPEYSQEELALREDCLSYLRDRINKKPTFADGKALDHKQIMEIAKEAAIAEGWQKAGFFEETYKGHRQLSHIDRSGGKRVKYTFISNNLPVGDYYFEVDPNKFFISKNDQNSAVAPIRLMINGRKEVNIKPKTLEASA